MQFFNELFTTYQRIDNELAQKEAQANIADDSREADTLKRQRRLNEQAYFLLLFAQFESHINTKCSELIQRERDLATWEQNRAWSILPHRTRDIERIAFMDRVALLTPKGHSEYNSINSYYSQRCDLAHGNLFDTDTLIPVIAAELQELAGKLRT